MWEIIGVFETRPVRRFKELFVIRFLFEFPQQVTNLINLTTINSRSDLLRSSIIISTSLLLNQNYTEKMLDEGKKELLNQLLLNLFKFSFSHHDKLRSVAHASVISIFQHEQKLEKEKRWITETDLVLYSTLLQFGLENEAAVKILSKHKIGEWYVNPSLFSSIFSIFCYFPVVDSFAVSEYISTSAFVSYYTPHLSSFLYLKENLHHNFPIEFGPQPPYSFDSSITPSTTSTTSSSSESSNKINPPIENKEEKKENKEEKEEKVEFYETDLREKYRKQASNYREVQEKIVPWDFLELDNVNERKAQLANKKRQSIIIVASLVDKIPNLGGLCRTCEIFSAGLLVIPDLKMAQDKNFTSVSVTSENWMPILGVQPGVELFQFLQQKRKEGYLLCGLEQTSDSVNIVSFQFPEKVVILLGMERYGIPVEYLGLLDKCVEIPQLGIIRSLNVHVSASILLYEYTKQRSFLPQLSQF